MTSKFQTSSRHEESKSQNGSPVDIQFASNSPTFKPTDHHRSIPEAQAFTSDGHNLPATHQLKQRKS